jgi:hypothetical protein
VSAGSSFGTVNTGQQALLARPAFNAPLAPALPKALRKPIRHDNIEQHRSAVRSTLANLTGLEIGDLENFDVSRYFGPFFRCFDILVPEWVPFFEVPDISFKVTQDVDGTGTQVTVYSDGLFEVPWSSSSPNVTLVASPIAFAVPNCNVPHVPCGDVPSLEYVGLMPLVNPGIGEPYVDPVAGYATRPNQPRPSGTLSGPQSVPSTAPYCDTLQFYGCTAVDGAAYYRLEYTYTAPGSTTASGWIPFTGLTWPLYLEAGGSLTKQWPISDADGWYSVVDPSVGWFPQSMVLEWDTTTVADGLYTIRLQVADSGKNLLETSTSVGIDVDNSAPKITWTADWSFSQDMSGAQPVPTDNCPVINRGTPPHDVYVQVTYSVTANHLRSVQAGAGGCSAPALLSAVASTQHWYENADDNSFSGVALYKIPASAQTGVYSFNIYADSRAFNPAGSDNGQLADWNYNPVYKYSIPQFSFGIVNQ